MFEAGGFRSAQSKWWDRRLRPATSLLVRQAPPKTLAASGVCDPVACGLSALPDRGTVRHEEARASLAVLGWLLPHPWLRRYRFGDLVSDAMCGISHRGRRLGFYPRQVC